MNAPHPITAALDNLYVCRHIYTTTSIILKLFCFEFSKFMVPEPEPICLGTSEVILYLLLWVGLRH